MYTVQIKTIGEVALANDMNSAVGYKYDVPVDDMGIPYIPLGGIFAEQNILPEGAHVGFAKPDGYMGLVRSASTLKANIPNCVPYIRSYFTNERFVPLKQYTVRALKPGQVFTANLSIDSSQEKQVREALRAITHIGVSADGITGEVSVNLLRRADSPENIQELRDDCRYASLDLSFMLVTPTCFYAPYADGAKTESYIPGAVIRDQLMRELSSAAIDWDGITCTNAYISVQGQRMLPTPICVSVVKLDKTQLRYRLAPGKDPRITEQDVGLQGTFAKDVHKHLVSYTSPEIEHVLSRDGTMYDALLPGQVFCGRIYGSDSDMRTIAEYIGSHPLSNIGALAEEGFGEVYCRVNRLNEKKITAEELSRCFDVCCVSDTLILNDKGMPTCRAEDLMAEIEYALGLAPGKLRLAGKYTNVHHDFSRNLQWQEDRAVVRCFAKGSVLRLEVVGEPIDISGISHCFIGERTEDGYGELIARPARGEYYRLAEKMLPPRYEMQLEEPIRSMEIGSHLTNAVIISLLRSRIQGMAVADRLEYQRGIPVDQLIPMDILRMMKDRYDPMLDDALMVVWYCEGLRGGTVDGKLN